MRSSAVNDAAFRFEPALAIGERERDASRRSCRCAPRLLTQPAMAPPPTPTPTTPSPGGVQFSHRLLKTSVENPYDTFTAESFDTWVGDLTSSIRAALNNKSRGKARDPREGAGIEGLRRELAASRTDDDSFDATPNGHLRADEPADGSSFVLTPLSDVQQLQDEEEEDTQSAWLERDMEQQEETYDEAYERQPQQLEGADADEADGEYVELDAIYTTNGTLSETS